MCESTSIEYYLEKRTSHGSIKIILSVHTFILLLRLTSIVDAVVVAAMERRFKKAVNSFMVADIVLR